MKLDEIEFEDDAFRAAVLATGETEAESVTVIRCRKQKIGSARGIEHLPNLKVLDLTRNRLSSLDLSGNTRLQQLFVGNNQLEELDLSALPELEGLEIFMNEISEIDLADNARLEVLYANGNDLDVLDLRNNRSLCDIQLSDNRLRELKLAAGLAPESLSARNNRFSEEAKAELRSALEGCQLSL